jgi:hypothetical protein
MNEKDTIYLFSEEHFTYRQAVFRVFSTPSSSPRFRVL